MKYKYSICQAVAKTLPQSLKHASLHKNESNLHIRCPFTDCRRTFRKVSSLKSHIFRSHKRDGIPVAVITCKSVSLICTIDTCIRICRDVKSLLSHLKGHITEGKNVSCPFVGCSLMFENKSTFSSHISRCHRHAFQRGVCQSYLEGISAERNMEAPTNLEMDANSAGFETCAPGEQRTEDCHSEVDGSKREMAEGVMHQESLCTDITDAFGRFYPRLLSESLVPSRTVQVISEDICDLQNNNLDHMPDALRRKMRGAGLNRDFIDLAIKSMFGSDVIVGLHSSSGVFRSTYSRREYLQSKYDYVQPVAVRL